jgi:hypothetical protein
MRSKAQKCADPALFVNLIVGSTLTSLFVTLAKSLCLPTLLNESLSQWSLVSIVYSRASKKKCITWSEHCQTYSRWNKSTSDPNYSTEWKVWSGIYWDEATVHLPPNNGHWINKSGPYSDRWLRSAQTFDIHVCQSFIPSTDWQELFCLVLGACANSLNSCLLFRAW